MPLSDSSILNEVALMTDWFSAADLANLIKEVCFIIVLKIWDTDIRPNSNC